jgi:hypothetical protein
MHNAQSVVRIRSIFQCLKAYYFVRFRFCWNQTSFIKKKIIENDIWDYIFFQCSISLNKWQHHVSFYPGQSSTAIRFARRQ